MIRSWANVMSRRFFETGKSSKFRGLDSEAAQELLATLDAATALQDLSPLKSVGLHKLIGDRKGHPNRISVCKRRQGDSGVIGDVREM